MITVILKPGLFRPGFTAIEEGSQLLANTLYRISAKPQSWRPPTDIYETADQYMVLIEIAGMQDSDFLVNLDRNILTISGQRKSPVDERRAFHQMEIPFGEFIVHIEFSERIELEKIEASYENGFLRINLPKEKPKSIDIIEE